MASPWFQPISSSRSAIGSVAIMSLDITKSLFRRGRRAAARALVAITTLGARNVPCAVVSVTVAPRSMCVTLDCSCTCTPASSA